MHTGFADAQAAYVVSIWVYEVGLTPVNRSATQVLSAVNETFSKYKTKSVTVIGHSLGKCDIDKHTIEVILTRNHQVLQLHSLMPFIFL